MTPDQGIIPRGIYTEISRKPLIVTPTAQQIARIAQIPKAEYVSPLQEESILVAESNPNLEIISWVRDIGKFLAGRLEEKFGALDRDEFINSKVLDRAFQGNVCLRATACSLEGNFTYRGRFYPVQPWEEPEETTIHIASLEDLLGGRNESGRTVSMVEPVDLRNEQRIYKLGKFPERWLFRHATGVRETLLKHEAGDKVGAIFPVLMAYDLKFCQGNFGDGYRVHLPSEIGEAREAVLGGFVVDLPV